MSSSMSTKGNIKESPSQQEIKPQILHNRMPPGFHLMGAMGPMSPQMTNCTPGNVMLSEGQDAQILGYPYGHGYHHLFPYGGWYGGYGGYGGYGYGYPYRGCYPYGCGRGSIWNYPWY